MQVVVKRSDLSMAANENVVVYSTYEDNVVVEPPSDQYIVLSVSPTAISGTDVSSGIPMQVLNKDWRDGNRMRVLGAEATRRIDAVFPEYSQRNSTAELTGYIAQYGADSSKWPAPAKARKAEIDRCWNYVNAVRAKMNSMAALPADPTGNSNWPTIIAPYKPM